MEIELNLMTHSFLFPQNGRFFWMIESEDALSESDHISLAQLSLSLDLHVVYQAHGIVVERHEHNDAILILKRAVIVEDHVVTVQCLKQMRILS